MEFLVIDFETANNDNSSICQIGLVKYDNGNYITLIDTLINPETEFLDMNVSKHHITENDVQNAPTFDEVYSQLEIMDNCIVFNHNGSDKSKFESACKKYDLMSLDITWLNSATLVRRTWEEFSQSGYGVENMCNFLGIELLAHNAASDALATAKIIIEASKIKNITNANDWIKELTKRNRKRNYIGNGKTEDYQKLGGELMQAPDLDSIKNKENPFYGKKVVVSGTYRKWPDRKVLAQLLKDLGADIDSSIGKKTNYLCKGNGVGPSKLAKMQKKIDNGEDAKIIDENEIIRLLNID